MKFTLPPDTFNSSQLTTRNISRQCIYPLICNLHIATAPKNIESDTLLHQEKQKYSENRLVNKKVNEILDGMIGLQEQNTIIDFISQQRLYSSMNQEQKVCEELH